MVGNAAAKYQPYPAYKPADVEWLGDIPEGWGHAPLKYMALEEKSLFLDGDWIESKDLSDDGIRYITTGNVGEGVYKEQGGGYISEETFKKINASEVFEGDILVSRLNPPIGRACMVPDLFNRIVTSVDNVIFRPDTKFHRGFVVYMLSSREYFGHTSNMARGATMQRISRGLLGNIRIVFPPIPEQTKIASFLDHETAKIDALIAKQQRLIALLEEKRQAVISHAVTKGLDPAVPLHPSGIDWLGDVPAHWEICIAKFKYTTTTDGAHISPDLVDGKHHFVSVKDVRNRAINFDDALLTSTKNFDYLVKNGCKPQTGDVLYSKDGTIGETVVCPNLPDFVVASSLIIIRPDQEQLDARFYEFLLRSYVIAEQVNSYVKGAALPRLSIQNFLKSIGVFPPLREQREIAEFLIEQSTQFDQLSASAQSAITLLKERRTALISAAVTGKIDLRDWQAPEGASDASIQDGNHPEEALA